MGCSFSGLNALYDAVNGGGDDVWINENRFRIVRQLGEGGFTSVFLVREIIPNGAATAGALAAKLSKNPSHVSVINLSRSVLEFTFFDWLTGLDDGTYAMKKILIQSPEQLELVREEIRVSSLFNHPNILPLLDHAIIAVKSTQGESWKHEAYLLFPLMGGTLMEVNKTFFSALRVLHIFRQVCTGLKHMHTFDPPYAHNDVKPGNVLLKWEEFLRTPRAVLDFGSARPARREVHSRSEALRLQEWAAEHCSAPFRAPELWDCPSYTNIDERTDIWSLGCTLYAIMYGVSPFEYALGESGGSLELAIINAQIKWPPGPKPPYPEALQQIVVWLLQPQPAMRPHIDDILIHVDRLISNFYHTSSFT